MATRTAQAIADLLAETLQKHRAATMHHEANVATQATTNLWEQGEVELAQRWRDVLEPLIGGDDAPPELAGLRDVLANPGHQTDFIFGILAVAGLVVQAIFAASEGKAATWRAYSLGLYGDLPLPPEVAVQAAATRRIDVGTAANYAQHGGIKAGTFEDWLQAAYNVPAFGALIQMVNRNIAGEGEAERALQQAGYTDDWIARMLRLRVNPPTTEEALIAELEGYLSAGEVEDIMRLNGDDVAAHSWRYESRGQPPPISELTRLWRRGFISDGEMYQALIEGIVKNKYIPAILKFKEVLPTFRQVLNMVSTHTIDEALGLDLLEQNGYSPFLAAKMIAYATRAKTSKEHDETKAEVVASYGLRLVDRDQAQAMLRRIGLTDDAAVAVLNLADAKREGRLLDEAVGRIRAAYTSWKVTEGRASAMLDQLAVPTDYRDDLLHTWEFERDVNRKHLTAAQVAGLWVRGVYTDDEAVAKLTDQGYSDVDARALLQLQAPKPKARAT